MLEKWTDELLSIVVCPRCRSPIELSWVRPVGNAECQNASVECRYQCTNDHCKLAREGFPVLDGQPVLIDFDASIVDRLGIVRRNGDSTQPRDVEQVSLPNKVRRLLFGENEVAKRIAAEFVHNLASQSRTSRVLVIGGATIGNGAACLYSDPNIEIISADIYLSSYTTFVADGHRLPLADHTVDAVWIQAVLEHVLDPGIVVGEIYRVLKPGGLVFADTPFMQQVHEGLYDFTRFTLHGQRWLFRRFEMLDAGVTRGAATSLIWSIRYFVRALTRSGRLGTLASFALFWLAPVDRLLDQNMSADAASGVYFFGKRSDCSITPRDMAGFYDELHALHANRKLAWGAGSGSAAPPPTVGRAKR